MTNARRVASDEGSAGIREDAIGRDASEGQRRRVLTAQGIIPAICTMTHFPRLAASRAVRQRPAATARAGTCPKRSS